MSERQATPIEQPTATMEVTEPIGTIDTEEPTVSLSLQAAIDELIATSAGLIEIVVAVPDGSVLYELNSTEPMEAASLYKLGIMVEVYRLRELGELSFDDSIVLLGAYFLEDDSVYGEEAIGMDATVDALLANMIDLSSNVAATALLAYVGNKNVNATVRDLGLMQTEIRWSPDGSGEPVEEGTGDKAPGIEEPSPDESTPPQNDADDAVDDEPVSEPETEPEGYRPQWTMLSSGTARPSIANRTLADLRADSALNVTTAADIALFYQLLLNEQVVSPEASQEMLALLSQQQINDRLPRYLPPGTRVAHKTGNVDGLVHDAGIIWADAGPIIVAVMTDIADDEEATELIAQITRLAFTLNS